MEKTAENKMGTKPVWPLLTMAVPVILSTAAQSLYNIMDGIFVSMLGEDAVAAVGFALMLKFYRRYVKKLSGL